MLVTDESVDGYISWLVEQGALRVVFEDGQAMLIPDMDKMKEVAPDAHDVFYGSLLGEVGELVNAGLMSVEYDDKSNDFLFIATDVEEDLE
jgi:hypothetical protein